MPQSRRKPVPRCGIVSPDAARRGISACQTELHEFIHARAQTWRREIVQARIRLADDSLSYPQRAELWRIVDYREWWLKMLVADFPAELERIDREIEDELRR